MTRDTPARRRANGHALSALTLIAGCIFVVAMGNVGAQRQAEYRVVAQESIHQFAGEIR